MIGIRKIFTLIITIGLIIIGLFAFEPFSSAPPTPIVKAGDTKIPTTQGSYCWNGLFSVQCVDKVYTSPIDMAKEHKPTVVSLSEEIKIDFRKEPLAETMKVEQWIDEKYEKLEVKNNLIVMPKEKGVYVYFVSAEWKEGGGSYAFSVEVK